MRRNRPDNLIDKLIRPPRRIYRQAQIRMVGLTHIERSTETKLRSNGDAYRDTVLAETLQAATELRSA